MLINVWRIFQSDSGMGSGDGNGKLQDGIFKGFAPLPCLYTWPTSLLLCCSVRGREEKEEEEEGEEKEEEKKEEEEEEGESQQWVS